MSFKEVVFPYWENIARGYEDIFAIFLIVKSILLIVPVIFIATVVIACWKRRTWSLKQGIVWIQDALYENSARRAQKKKGKGGEK